MIATDVMHCNHHHHISVIWVHLEKLVDEISSRTHWSGTPSLPLPLLRCPPFLQVNGTAAQQHFIILFIVTMATITGVTKSMITAIMTIITLVTITRVGMNDQQQLEFTSLAVYFSKNLSYLAKLVS